MIPSEQESAEALLRARQALEDHQRFWLGNVGKVELEFFELDLLEDSERFMAVDIALGEITPKDRDGPPPPDNVTSHPPFCGFPMYAFCWSSPQFSRRMYFKFALIPGSGKTQMGKTKLAIYAFHEPRTIV
jgi:hypothetical protein